MGLRLFDGGGIFLFLVLMQIEELCSNIWISRLSLIVMIVFAILAIVVIMTTFKKYNKLFSKETKVGRLLQFIGTRTLDIYLLHYLFLPYNLVMVGDFFKLNVNPLLEFFISVLLALLVIAVCLAVSAVVRTSSVLATLLFGVKSKPMDIDNIGVPNAGN